MKLVLFTVFVLCLGALYVVWSGRPKIFGRDSDHQLHLLGRSLRLCLLLLLSGVTASLLVGMLSGHLSRTTLGLTLKSTIITYDLLNPPADLGYVADSPMNPGYGGSSWTPMATAVKQLREHPDTPVYSEVFFKDKIKFQYPPTTLLFLDLPQRITGCSWANLFRAINLMCWFCLPALGVVFYSLFTRAAASPGMENDVRLTPSWFTVLTLMSLAVVASFYPVLWSYYLGQIQTPMTLFGGLALVAWQRKRFALAGFFIGLCCGIKPQWLAIVPWAVLRRQWRMLTGLVVTVGVLFLLSVAAYGIGNFVDYFSVLSFLGKHGESYFSNQTVNGLVNRLFFDGDNVNWAGYDLPPFQPKAEWVGSVFPPFNSLVYALTLGSSLLIIGIATFWKVVRNPSGFDLALIMLSLTMASPIAWEHHYGILLPIFAVVLPAAISQRPFGAWTTAYVWLAFLLTSQTFDGITSHLAGSSWNVLRSYLLFGAVMVLLLLYRISYLQQNARHRVPAFSEGDPQFRLVS